MAGHRVPTGPTLPSDQPLAISLINTRTRHRGLVFDHLSDPRGAQLWIRAAGCSLRQVDQTGATALQSLRALRRPRYSITHLAEVQTGQRRPSSETQICIAYLNQHRSPARFHLAGEQLTIGSGSTPFEEFRQACIDSATAVLAAPERLALRKCPSDQCLHYFVPYIEARVWCSPACGNRTRVARRSNSPHKASQ